MTPRPAKRSKRPQRIRGCRNVKITIEAEKTIDAAYAAWWDERFSSGGAAAAAAESPSRKAQVIADAYCVSMGLFKGRPRKK